MAAGVVMGHSLAGWGTVQGSDAEMSHVGTLGLQCGDGALHGAGFGALLRMGPVSLFHPLKATVEQTQPAVRQGARVFLWQKSSASLSNGGAVQTQESGIKESVSWGTQRTQEVPYEARTPLERGHSTKIPVVQPGKPAVGVQIQSMALRGPDGEPQPGLESQGRAACMPRPAAETQPGPNASPMKRSISTLEPQRPHMAHLCIAALHRAPASQAAPHHHHHCRRRRDRNQKSLEKGPACPQTQMA
ncbi:voltage-dependent N-type calcium channel subunit alpha-1B-like, partial [Callorhinus ursinus]|uniref:voltage-dependent N-type calcium channel subunit alpha-1B-like n=1 Tax=Callorhinus ursinus TaxID=34884 RepID=UPI003CD04C49